eukprot:TRINITY_DN67399_c0_g1_i1.p2 TRINITY_DN67399_c0_g1~~TRINITY_DN67399_c0_g1_i1.p2  ORF type:complete len:112 (-),score=27.27 TRINITY_DN67399_c0_g1_i1:60-395(-)
METIMLVMICALFPLSKLLNNKFLKDALFPVGDMSFYIALAALAASFVQDIAISLFALAETGYEFAGTFSAPFAKHNRFLHVVIWANSVMMPWNFCQVAMSLELKGAAGSS